MADQNNQQSETDRKLLATARASRAAWSIVVVSGLYYPARLFASILYLMSFAGLYSTEETWLGWLDIFGMLEQSFIITFTVALAINVTLSLFTFLAAQGIFMSFRINPWRNSLSIVVAAGSFALNAVPGLNLIDGIWIWLLYVVKSQANETSEDAEQ